MKGWRSAVWLSIAAILAANSAQAVEFRQLSNPTGIMLDQTTTVTSGDVVSTVYAPYSSGDWRFAYWEINGVRQLSDGYSSHAVNRVTFTAPSTNIYAEAFYVDVNADSDGDGMRDWYEFLTFGGLSREPANDSDGDGIDNASEYANFYSGREVDTLVEGGVSSADSSIALFIDGSSGMCPYTIVSDPLGLISDTGVVASGTTVNSPYLVGDDRSYTFIGWSINGERQTTPEGLALNQVSAVLTGAATFTAHYIYYSEDSDDDGMYDAYEWQQFGGLQNAQTENVDGDAYTIREELSNRLSPVLVDTIAVGGVSAADSSLVEVVATNKTYYRVSSMPLGVFNAYENYVDVGTAWNSGYINEETHEGYQFSYWSINGVRQTGPSGISLQRISTTISAATGIVAHYILPTENTDSDGLYDWKEMFYFGTLDFDETDDFDDDGLTISKEKSNRYGMTVKDSWPVGGISAADSVTAHFELGTRRHYVIRSQPIGLIDSEGYEANGTTIYTPYVADEMGGMYFAYWAVNGVRQADASGYALQRVMHTLDRDVEIVAVFMDPGADEDGDGIADYKELRNFGTLAKDKESDPDGDGLTVGHELVNSYAPQLKDTFAAGGVSAADSVPASIIFIRKIHAWGLDTLAQCGIPAAVHESRMLDADCGANHSLVSTSDGRVLGWGDNASGQLAVPALSDATAVAAGYNHSLALCRDGRVVGWGANGSGQRTIPEDLAAVVEISAGESHSAALLANGHVRVWGANTAGQCNVPEGLGKVVRIAAGGRHMLALHADGTVTAWGDDSEGQSRVPDGLSNVVEISAGDAHSLALKSNGTIISWGRNVEGQCTVPGELVGQAVIQIAAGHYHNLALLADGSVVAWGSDTAGETIVPEWIDDVTAIAAGRAHSIALRLAAEPGFVATVPGNMVFEIGADLILRTYGNAAQPQTFQWYMDGELIDGATTPFLFVENVNSADEGNYYCAVGNSLGSISSTPIGVNLLPNGYFNWLNLYFNNAEMQNTEVYDYEKDPDGDGLPNLVEYQFAGFSPSEKNALPRWRKSEAKPGYMEYSYTASSQAENAALQLLCVDDLSDGSWAVFAPDGELYLSEQDGEITTVYIREDVTSFFIRFKATME